MTYDLRSEPWIPFRRRSGLVEWGSPALLTDRLAEDPVVALAAPRPDFDGALLEFLIGLLSVAIQAVDENEWYHSWHLPPSPDELRRHLESLPAAFDLEGDGPRFFQDLTVGDFAREKPVPVEELLIDIAGQSGQFTKRERINAVGRPAAAMALLVLQTYASEGGRGHRTSMRGGGPLTTLVDPRTASGANGDPESDPLWEKLWANVETLSQWKLRGASGGRDPDLVFPWLAPTRTSSGGKSVAERDADPAQCYFGLPRRIRLEFSADRGTCDLIGRADGRLVTGFRTRPHGVQYERWHHPLSPHYRSKGAADWFPVHGQPGGVGWKDWLSLTLPERGESTREPARVVAHFLTQRADRIGRDRCRVHAFGYDFKQMKARSWVQAQLPAVAVHDEHHRQLVHDAVKRVTDATGVAAGALVNAIKEALFAKPKEVKGDFSQAATDLWDATNQAFYGMLQRLLRTGFTSEDARSECVSFAQRLDQEAVAGFDRRCPSEGVPPDVMRRLVTARYDLRGALRGYGGAGRKFYDALGLVPPSVQRTRAQQPSKDPREAIA